MTDLKKFLGEVYYGYTPRALFARYVFLVFDLLIVSYFVVTTFLEFSTWVIYVDIAIGVVLLVDFLGRLIAQRDRFAFLAKPLTIIDFVVIVSLFVPALIGNFAFLRLVRSLRLMRSYIVVRELREDREGLPELICSPATVPSELRWKANSKSPSGPVNLSSWVFDSSTVFWPRWCTTSRRRDPGLTDIE